MEAVKFCMPHIDGQVMEKLVPRLADIIKSGIGVSTKVRQSVLSCLRWLEVAHVGS